MNQGTKMAEETGKRGAGRPKIEITPEILEKAETYAKLCDNNIEIARALGFSPDTLYKRKNECKELIEALDRGRATANIFVGGKLMEAIKAGNMTAIIFYLKTRAGWRETVKVESEANVKVQEKSAKEIVAEMSQEELMEIARLKIDG